MKYDERTCKFNMDTGCVELLLRDGRKISINCTGVEDALDVTMAQRSELDYLTEPFSYREKVRIFMVWCDREDSNLWPSGSEPNALSS